MHVTNPDALKAWLTIELEPLCDADPEALARYVLALLKKGKPEKELQESMLDQLDVFLGNKTQSFLARLLDTIKSESYVDQSTRVNSGEQPATVQEATVVPLRNEILPPAASPKEDSIRVGPPPSDDAMRQELSQHSSVGTHSPIKAPVTNTESSTAQHLRRQRLSARSRSRSRSRSNERASRSIRNPRDSRDRVNRPSGGGNSLLYRNKSPPRRFERRGGGNKGGAMDRYNHSRRNHSRSRSRSHSPNSYRKAMSRSLSPHQNNNSSQNTDNGEPRIQSQVGAQIVGREKGKKCRDFEEKGYCMRGETCPWDHGVDPVVLEDINNPTLMNIQQQQQQIREYNPDAPDLWNRNAPVGGNVGGFGPRGPSGPGPNGAMRGGEFGQRLPFRLAGGPVVGGGIMNPGGLSQLNRELIPVPVMMDGQAAGHPGMYHQNHHHQAMDGSGGIGSSKRRYEDQNQPLVPGMEGPPKRKPLLPGRLGPRGSGGGPMGQNCSLELRKVPRGLNSIAHLNNHFSRFGKIINIQVNYEHDPEAAVISFSSHAEANVAYRSTEAVLNNRFIKVFWHTEKEEGSESNKDAEQTQSQKPGGPRKMFTNQYQLNNVQNKTQQDTAGELSTKNTDGAAPQVAASPQVAAPGQLRLHTQRGIANRRQQEEQVKQAVKMAHGLVKKKHELLQEYLKQMRSCLELIEKVDALDPQRAKLLETLKNLQESIDKLRKEIAEEQAQLTAAQQKQQQHPGIVVRKTKEQQQKELLDMELELIAQQQEGNDTTHIRKRIEELQRSLGRSGAFPRGPSSVVAQGGHTGAPVTGARTAPPGSTSVDRRPTTIFVAGFKLEDSDALLGHFKHFGEITKNVLDRNIPSLIISFAVRVHAEQAMLRGRIFKERPLKMNWYIPNFVKQREPAGDTSENSSSIKEPVAEDKSEIEEVTTDDLTEGGRCSESVSVTGLATEDELPSVDDELRLDEEEEEEDLESEDRSWRR